MPEAPGLYRFSYSILSRATRLLRGMRVEGAENIPATGRIIVAANHISWLDPPLMSMAIYAVRYPQFLAKEELFRVPVLGAFLTGIGCIPLDRGRGDVGAIRRALEVLEREGCMGLFPEGTRSKTGEPGRPKAGVGLLARQTGARVVPARVFNTRRLFDREPLRVSFGKPMAFEGGEGKAEAQAFAERVMEQIFRLQ